MRAVKEFRTACGYCANGSIVEAVRQEDKGTDASWLRMFEMNAIDLPKTEKEFAFKVNEHLTELHFNYGGIGLVAAGVPWQESTLSLARGWSTYSGRWRKTLARTPRWNGTGSTPSPRCYSVE